MSKVTPKIGDFGQGSTENISECNNRLELSVYNMWRSYMVLTNPHMKPRIKFIIMKIFMKIVKICPKSPRFTVFYLLPTNFLKIAFISFFLSCSEPLISLLDPWCFGWLLFTIACYIQKEKKKHKWNFIKIWLVYITCVILYKPLFSRFWTRCSNSRVVNFAIFLMLSLL